MNVLADQVFRFKRLLRGRQAARRTRLYCVGTAKSGTHSICSMFSRNVRARHEPESLRLIKIYFDWQDGRINDTQLRDWIRTRDQAMALEVDSSWFNILILKFLIAEFPDARFVLTIRDCYSWLNSEFKRVLHTPSQQPLRIKLRDHIYGTAGSAYAPEEQVLQSVGLYPVDGYLSRWVAHNEQVLALIPSERLLIIRTPQIGPRAGEIADFARLPRYAIKAGRTHEYRNPKSRQIIRELDPHFVEKKVAQHCRPLMDRFFPEIKTLNDVKF